MKRKSVWGAAHEEWLAGLGKHSPLGVKKKMIQ